MTLGCEDVGDRIQNAALLGGALRLDGGANGRGVDAEGLGELRDGGSVRAGSALLDPESNRPDTDAAPLGEVCPRLVGLREPIEQVDEQFGSLGHAAEGSEVFRSLPESPLDFLPKFTEDCPRQEREPGSQRQSIAGPADSEPSRNEAMETVATVPTESQLRFAREVLDRAEAEGIDTTELAASIAAANDAAALDTDVHEARYRLNDFCAHCNEDIDADGTGSLRWCSRECWLADGGDS